MKQSPVISRLSLISGILCGAGMLLQLLTILVAPAILKLRFGWTEPLSAVGYALLLGLLCLHVPFLILAVMAWRRDALTRQFSWITVLGGSGAYLFDSVIGYLLITIFGTRLMMHMTGIEAVSAYSTVRGCMGYFNVFFVAALVFLCCAGAIGLYSTSNQISPPSDGGKEELA